MTVVCIVGYFFAFFFLRVVVGKKLLWKAMACENCLETIDRLCHTCAVYWKDFGPFGVGVDQKQEHRSEESSSKIHVDS